MSLRDLLWQYFYGAEAPQNLTGKEIVVSLIITVFLLALYWVFQKIIFYGINDNARYSRAGAKVLSISLAAGWLTASLNLLGLWTSLIVLVLVFLAIMVDLIFLLVTRGK
ncbi:MAG: hypothetical protein QXZ09_04145 [Candidatus Methanomethylicaceae archaeon]